MKPFMFDPFWHPTTTGEWILVAVGLFIVVLAGGTIVFGIYEWFLSYLGLDPYYNYNYTSKQKAKTTTHTPYVVPKTTYTPPKSKADVDGFLPGDRKAPPAATFFGRTGNDSFMLEGTPDISYLTAVELRCWRNKMRRLGRDPDEIEAKSAIFDDNGAFLGQNDAFKGYRG